MVKFDIRIRCDAPTLALLAMIPFAIFDLRILGVLLDPYFFLALGLIFVVTFAGEVIESWRESRTDAIE